MSIKAGMKELVLIAGSGRLGSGIASELTLQGSYIVLIIDDYMGAFAKLKRNLISSVTGIDVTDTEALERCGIETSHYFIAATDNDNANIMIAQIAKEVYHVPNVIAIIQNDERKAQLLEGLDIQTVCPNLLAIDRLKGMFDVIHGKKNGVVNI